MLENRHGHNLRYHRGQKLAHARSNIVNHKNGNRSFAQDVTPGIRKTNIYLYKFSNNVNSVEISSMREPLLHLLFLKAISAFNVYIQYLLLLGGILRITLRIMTSGQWVTNACKQCKENYQSVNLVQHL